MRHGIDGFFFEQAANLRRLALVVPTVALVLAGAMLGLARGTREREIDLRHFGFEGTDEYVRRIRLETIGTLDQPGLTQLNVSTKEARKGGGDAPAQKRTEGGQATAGRRVGEGPGASDDDMVARARAMQLDAPVIRSEELVIDLLVRPVYPDEARDNNVEGTVEVLALVDTSGAVEQVQILGGTGNTMLERAATAAVLQCRYRPFRRGGRPERVYAAFRIRFSLY